MEAESDLLERVAALTGATKVRLGERVQELWSGYGEIRRLHLEGARVSSVIVKRVAPPAVPQHRRGWASARSHQRKLRSYDVEMAWYRDFAERCGSQCRVPRALESSKTADRWTFVLEDLDAAGLATRHDDLDPRAMKPCLDWLAHFHATFLGTPPAGLWPDGTYWHLATRPDELAVTADPALRQAAPELDRLLHEGAFPTLVHGDAKVANFCFDPRGTTVAAVDFQYVGAGCGIRDVAYFFSSCLDSEDCQAHAPTLLDHYFSRLRQALGERHPDIDGAAVEGAWRALYPVAWADFSRFLSGWAPDHYKLHRYARQMTNRALADL